MAIELHCNHCGKLVRAPDDAGGKHGKCPTCHQSVYIPTPADQIEPLAIAPVDESVEAKQRRLAAEAARLHNRLLYDREAPPERAGEERRAEQVMPPPKPNMEQLIVEYAVAMAEGRLNDAERTAEDIRRDIGTAEDVMQRLTVDEIPPPKLAKIPRPVLVAFFKQLRGKG